MENRRQQILQKKQEEEKSRAALQEKKNREEAEKRRKEREEFAEKRAKLVGASTGTGAVGGTSGAGTGSAGIGKKTQQQQGSDDETARRYQPSRPGKPILGASQAGNIPNPPGSSQGTGTGTGSGIVTKTTTLAFKQTTAAIPTVKLVASSSNLKAQASGQTHGLKHMSSTATLKAVAVESSTTAAHAAAAPVVYSQPIKRFEMQQVQQQVVETTEYIDLPSINSEYVSSLPYSHGLLSSPRSPPTPDTQTKKTPNTNSPKELHNPNGPNHPNWPVHSQSRSISTLIISLGISNLCGWRRFSGIDRGGLGIGLVRRIGSLLGMLLRWRRRLIMRGGWGSNRELVISSGVVANFWRFWSYSNRPRFVCQHQLLCHSICTLHMATFMHPMYIIAFTLCILTVHIIHCHRAKNSTFLCEYVREERW
jgi:hypothetical protein